MNRQKLILIIGIILGLTAVFMVKLFIDQQRQNAQEEARRKLESMQVNQSAVLVAKRDIAKGVAIEEEMLDTAIVPKQYVQPQAATSLSRVDGMITIAPIAAGEQITLSKLTISKQAGGLASATPAGKRAITLDVDNIASLAGMIKPGDYVDVSYTGPVPIQIAGGQQTSQMLVIPLFQNTLVLAVGQQIGEVAAKQARYQDSGSKETPLITLALSPQEASLISFLHEQGRIRLALRSPADAKVEKIPPASWDTVFQHIMPEEEMKARLLQQQGEQEGEYVEIYRGLEKQKIPISE